MDNKEQKVETSTEAAIVGNTVLGVIAFIEAEIPKIEAERNKYKEPYNHAMYMNTDRRLDGAKLFLEWVASNYR
jgi:hypothetical protein